MKKIYNVSFFVTATYEDSIRIEADSVEQAEELAQDELESYCPDYQMLCEGCEINLDKTKLA